MVDAGGDWILLIAYAIIILTLVGMGLGIVIIMTNDQNALRRTRRRRRDMYLTAPFGTFMLQQRRGQRQQHHHHQPRTPNNNHNNTTLRREWLFEPADMTFYRTTQVPWTPNYLDFHFDDGEVDIYDPESQNVHDTIVQRSIRNKFQDCSSSPSSKGSSFQNVKDRLLAFANSHFPVARRQKVSEVLKTIEARDTPIFNLDGKTEKDILGYVFSNVEPGGDHTELILQLEDCVENGQVVCSTGVATRIMNTLFLKDPDNAPKTRSVVRQAMLQDAATLRSQFPDDSPSAFTQRLESYFTSSSTAGSLLLSDDEIKQEIASWGADI